jgi:DNA-binding response OmpR family regulator
MADIVVVDDESDLLTVLRAYLEQCGHRVRTAESGQALQRHLKEAKPHLVVLDLSLPGESGLAIARQLREHHDLGIIMLTAAIDPIDRIVGLEIGADDYVTKPCDFAELAARIEAVLRRRKQSAAIVPGMLSFGSYRFDTKGFRLLDAAGVEVVLTAMEVDLVAAFATNPGKVLDRTDLMRLAPPRSGDSFDRSIDHRLKRLRHKLEVEPDKPTLIRTVRGSGYVYMPEQDPTGL